MTVLSSQAERTLSFTVFIGSLPVFGDFFVSLLQLIFSVVRYVNLRSAIIQIRFARCGGLRILRGLDRFFSRSDQFHVLLNFIFGDR